MPLLNPRLPAAEPALTGRLRALRHETVFALTRVLDALSASTPEQDPTERESPASIEAALHVDSLQAALEFGDVEAYAESLAWLERFQRGSANAAERILASLHSLTVLLLDRLDEREGAVVARYLAAAWDTYAELRTSPAATLETPRPWPEVEQFESALLAGDVRAALATLDEAQNRGASLVDFEVHVIQPALYRIGDRWQCAGISVAQEHLASAIAQSVMAQGLLRHAPSGLPGLRVLLACVKGNRHSLGLRIVADALQVAGAEVQFLGGDVPSASLVQQVRTWRPDVLGLSVMFPQHLQTARRLVQRIREEMSSSAPKALLGGLGVPLFPSLTRRVGADFVCRDAKEAVAVVAGAAAG